MKPMYKFIIQCLLIIVLFACTDYIIGNFFTKLYNKAYSINPHSYIMIPRFAAEDVNSDILIIGASDASHDYIPSIITDSLNLSCYNLGRDGSFFIYQNCMINMILDRYKPKIIIWEMIEDCFGTPYDNISDFQSISSLYPLYDTNLYVHRIIDTKQKYQRLYMMCNLYRYNSTFLTLLKSVKTTWGSDNGYEPLPNEGYKKPTKCHENEINLVESTKLQLFRQTLERCKKENVMVILASAPRYTNGAIKESSSFKRMISIADEYNIPFIGKKDDAVFDNADYFKDIDHLNDYGAHKYMELFIPKLKEVIKQHEFEITANSK